ncbi:MAG TPA: RyR domain-containing protein [Gemmatimonadales bacterium]|nr:RyR domain-containing protein [Gemmatimonadales bacterium]
MNRDREPEPLTPAVREQLARAIHERYRRNQRDRKPASDPAMQPWDTLAETLKHSNRDQAADIANKLGAIGCRITPAGERPAAPPFTRDELERLAMLEHARWVAERREAGWMPGPRKDVDRKLTPYLVPWDELTEIVREVDRDAVRAIPDVLAEAGLQISRA